MSVTIRHVRAAAITTGGGVDHTQDLAISSGPGTTPVAAIFFMNRCITNGVEAAHNQRCVGVTDGTHDRCMVWSAEDNVGTTNCWTKAINNACLATIDPTTGTVDGHAVNFGFGTDKITISWGDFPAGAYFIDVILFFGTNISVMAGDFDYASGTSKTCTDVISSSTFSPEFVFGFSGCCTGAALTFTGKSTTSSVADSDMCLSMITGTTQVCHRIFEEDGIVLATLSGNHKHDILDSNVWWDSFAGGGSSSNLTLTSTGFNYGTDNGVCGFLALSFNNQVNIAIGSLSTPTATGANARTDIIDKPQFALLLQSDVTTLNIESNDNGSCYGIGIFSNGAAPIANTLAGRSSDVKPGPSVAKSRQNGTSGANSAWLLRNPDNTFTLTATLTSFDNTGWTENWTVVNATARLNLYVAIGETIPTRFDNLDDPLPDDILEVTTYG